jgi:predicted nucleic acid-binding protein
MSAEIFLDTNVLIYAVDPAAPPSKALRAQDLVNRGLATRNSCISSQVAQEFVNVILQRFTRPLAPQRVQDYVRTMLAPLCSVWPSIALIDSAIDLKESTRFHFYDCLIIAAALEARCRVLLSEDLQHGRRIGGLRIENPFL